MILFYCSTIVFILLKPPSTPKPNGFFPFLKECDGVFFITRYHQDIIFLVVLQDTCTCR